MPGVAVVTIQLFLLAIQEQGTMHSMRTVAWESNKGMCTRESGIIPDCCLVASLYSWQVGASQASAKDKQQQVN